MNTSPKWASTTSRFSGKRPTLGLLTNGFWHSLSYELWQGVRDAARKHDINLICFPGNELNSLVKQDISPASANVLYDLISAERLDGLLLWTGALGNFVSEQELRDFCCGFEPLPVICIGRKVEGLPYVDTDNVQCARGVMDHLVKEHGYRRILFIRGPAGHTGSEMRYQAYLDALEAYGIPFDPDLVTPAMDGWGYLEKEYRPYLDGNVAYAVQLGPLPFSEWPVDKDADSVELLHLLRRRNLMPGRDFDAFYGATDVIAALAVRRLQSIGIHVPKDVAAVGGGGRAEAEPVLQMRLTSGSLMLYEQGYHATEMMSAHWQGQPLELESIVPGRYYVNQSCGCLSDAVRGADDHLLDSSSPPDAQQITRVLRDSLGSAGRVLPPDFAGLVWDAFVADVGSGEPRRLLPVLSTLVPMIYMGPDAAGQIWQPMLSALRESALAFFPASQRPSAGSLLHKARMMVAELESRQNAFMELARQRKSALLFEISQTLIAKFDIQALLLSLIEGLPRIGIRFFYLSLYTNPHKPAAGLRLILAFDENGRINLPPEGLWFDSGQIVPKDFILEDAYSYVVEPLYFQDTQIGIAVFRTEPGVDRQVYQVLRAQISSALQGSLLVLQVQENAKDLQHANEQIQSLNEQLKDENVQMRTEMDLARRIQTSLLPQWERQLHPDFEIASVMLPADQVGGDYYDIALDQEGSLWFGIGDVSGHGVTPGLIMMMAQTVHTTITSNFHTTPRDAVMMINRVLLENVSSRLHEDHFMTFVTLKYLEDGRFQHAGAHGDLIVYRHRTATCELIETTGIWLNLISNIEHITQNAEFSLEVGDILVLYTDGLTEAWNAGKEIFGLPRLTDAIIAHAPEPTEQLRDSILEDVMAWCAGRQDDDMSLLVARRID